MRTLRLLTATVMTAAVLVLAPPANAQSVPTVTVTAGRPTAEDLVAIQPVTEGTADTDDIVVKEIASSTEGMEVHPYTTPNMHHQGGWVYIHEFFPYGQAKVRRITVEALDNLDGVNSETLATWVYVNGDLAGAQVLTITSGPQPQQ